MFNIRLTSGLNMISAWWHMVGVVLIVGILIIVPDHHQSLSYVFTETVNNSGYGGGTTSFSNPAFWFVFGLGLLLSQYTITGFDASAHTAEETNTARAWRRVGMWTSVFVSVVFGFILLVAVTFAIPGTQEALDRSTRPPDRPLDLDGVDGPHWAEFLLTICVVAQFFCVTASVTSASRMLFAFSRDGAVPGHQLWRRVARNRVPRWSVLAIAFMAGVLMVPAIWNYFIGYAVGTTIAVIGLYIAFVIPVYLRWRKGDSWDEPRAWTCAGTTSGSTRSRSCGWRSSRSSSCSRSTRRASLERRLQLGPRELHSAAGSPASGSSSGAGGRCPRRTGSRDRCAWAPRRSSSGSSKSAWPSSRSRPKC